MSNLAEAVRVDDVESSLERAGAATVTAAQALRIVDEPGYQAAGEFLRDVKTRAKQVAEYWKPAKDKAKAAHQDIVEREKAMLVPLKEAEAIVKVSMAAYQRAVEAERRRMAEEARKAREAETERLLCEAMAAEQGGDATGAAVNLAMAQMVEDMPSAPVCAAPKAAGTGLRKAWKARVIDPDAVPVSANGVLIRPVDLTALNSIARLTKGTPHIPGVEFYEETTISARAR